MTSVSVIIPNYNHAAFLRERMESVLQQTYKPCEIIILDDCSTDSSPLIISEYLKKYPEIKYIANTVNCGSTFKQWSKGLSEAKGELIWIAESDDSCHPDLLKSLVNCHFQNPDIGLAYCQSERVNSEGSITGSWKEFTEDLDPRLFEENFVMDGEEFISRFLIHKNVVPNASAVLFKKSIYEKVSNNGIPYLAANADWLTWLKILSYSKVAYLREPLNFFRYHSSSVIALLHHKEACNTYMERYDYNMRKEYFLFLSKNSKKIPKGPKKANLYYMALDKGNQGLFYLKNGKFFKGWKKILSASFYPVVQSGFIKKAIKSH